MAGNFVNNNNYIQPSFNPAMLQPGIPSASTITDTGSTSLGFDQAYGATVNMISGPQGLATLNGPILNHIQPGMNANHLPYSTGHSSIITTLSTIAPVSAGLRVTAPGSFTFTSPTRISHVSSSHLQTNPYGMYPQTSQTAQTFAPGLGASWQHSIPAQMPWTDSGSTAVPPTFTGSLAFGSPENVGVSNWLTLEPVASCSSLPRRPKRHAVDNGCDIPSKVLINEEKMTASMQELSLGHQCEQEGMSDNTMEDSSFTSQDAIDKSWKKFKELEEMLSDDSSFQNTTSSVPKTSGIKVHMAKEMADKLTSASSPLLPKDVLDSINKPCMQIVLWKPPVDKLREIVSQNLSKHRRKGGVVKRSSSSNSITSQSTSPLTCFSSIKTPISSTTSSSQSMIMNTEPSGETTEVTDMEL